MLWPKPGFEQQKKSTQPSRNFSCISSLKRQFSFFSLCAPALGMCLDFFSSTNTKLQVSSGLFALCQAPGKPCGRCAVHRSSAMYLSFELLCFQFPDSTGTFVQVFMCFLEGRILVPHQFLWNSTKKIFLSAQQDTCQKFEWCHHFRGASLFLGPYSENCPSSLVNQGLLLYILFWVLFPLVKMAILNNRIPCTARGDSWKP